LKKNNTRTIEDILKVMPHRQPFLLVDRVIEEYDPGHKNKVGRKIVAIKNVTYNEPFFAGHFPHRPIMPGVLILEAMAQAAGLACVRPGDPKMDVVVARFSEVRFHRPVVPGDQLVMESEVLKDRGSFFANRCRATVDGELVTEFEVLASVIFPKTEATAESGKEPI